MRKLLILLLLIYNNCIGTQHFLSFLMPCYNCANTVAKSIDSIYAQNISIPFEVVCTDDASTDETLTILRNYEQKYDNLTVYHHEHNQGGGVATNTCAQHAKGDLFYRLDSDNMLAPDTIDKLIDLIDTTGCDGASVQHLYFFQKDYVRHDIWSYNAPNNICDLAHIVSGKNNPAHSGNYIYTKKSFYKAGGYPLTHGGGDTFCFGFKQYATGARIAILPNTFYWHYYNPNGYWQRSERTGVNGKMALDVFNEYAEVFDQKTQNYLNTLKGNPLHYLGKGAIQLVNSTALNHLFIAHDLLVNKQINLAIKEFELAIEAGCKSLKLTNLLNHLKLAD